MQDPNVKVAVVSGASGFLGGHVVEALRRARHEVRELDRARREADFAGAECLIHLAWEGSVTGSTPGQHVAADTNISHLSGLFRAAISSGVRQIVFASSGGSVYGEPEAVPIAEDHPLRPVNSYGAAKAAAEAVGQDMCRGSGTRFVALRLSNLYGPGQRGDLGRGLIATAIWRALKDEEIDVWGDGGQLRDYLYVADAAEAFVKALGYQGDVPALNIGSGQGISVRTAIEQVGKAIGKPARMAFRPSRAVDISRNVLDVGLAARELGWRPATRFDQGIAATVDWAKRMLAGRP